MNKHINALKAQIFKNKIKKYNYFLKINLLLNLIMLNFFTMLIKKIEIY